MYRVSRMLSMAGLTDPWWFTEESRERGHIVHTIAEQVFAEQPVEVAPSYAGYRQALIAAKHALRFVAICVERRITDGVVTGRPDLIGWLPESVGQLFAGPAILDVKSGERNDSHGVQLAFYENLANTVAEIRQSLPERFRGLPWQRVGVYVRPDGKFKLHHYNSADDLSVAFAIADLTRWRHNHGLLDPGVMEIDDDPSLLVEIADGVNGPCHNTGPEQSGSTNVPTTGA